MSFGLFDGFAKSRRSGDIAFFNPFMTCSNNSMKAGAGMHNGVQPYEILID